MYRNRQLESCISELQCGCYFGGSSSGDADVTSRIEPWKDAKPHFTRLYNLASAAYDETDTRALILQNSSRWRTPCDYTSEGSNHFRR